MSSGARAAALPAVNLALLALLFAVILAAPLLPLASPTRPDILNRFAPPSLAHPMGQDSLGRDLLSRVIWGARTSLMVSVGAVALGASLGALLGMIAAMAGGWADSVLGRLSDLLLGFPSIILGILVVVTLGPSQLNLLLALGIAILPRALRLGRSSTLPLKQQEFVQAAGAYGAGFWRILRIHILRNASGPVLAASTLWLGSIIQIEAGLSYLGIGVQPPDASLGLLVRDGFQNILTAPWLAVFPGLVVFVIVMLANLIGDRVRDRLDVRTTS